MLPFVTGAYSNLLNRWVFLYGRVVTVNGDSLDSKDDQVRRCFVYFVEGMVRSISPTTGVVFFRFPIFGFGVTLRRIIQFDFYVLFITTL